MQHKCTGILRIPKNFWAKIIRLTLFMHALYDTLLHSIALYFTLFMHALKTQS